LVIKEERAMRYDLATKWITALRSGNYKQTKNVLKDEKGGFCCLGVLCDVMGYKFGPVQDVEIGPACPVIGADGHEFFSLPTEVQELAQIATGTGSFELGSDDEANFEEHDLAQMNDAGSSFEEIADLIESHWDQL
jgi:hypothetical protein